MSRGHVSRCDLNSGDALLMLASIWLSRVDSALIHERVAPRFATRLATRPVISLPLVLLLWSTEIPDFRILLFLSLSSNSIINIHFIVCSKNIAKYFRCNAKSCIFNLFTLDDARNDSLIIIVVVIFLVRSTWNDISDFFYHERISWKIYRRLINTHQFHQKSFHNLGKKNLTSLESLFLQLFARISM